jgi:hypothetical protein
VRFGIAHVVLGVLSSFTFVGRGLCALHELVDGIAESDAVGAFGSRIGRDDVEFGVSEDACDVGGLLDVGRGEPFPGDCGVGGAQVFLRRALPASPEKNWRRNR